ncbi:MAG TPA: P-loop NTPase fold protein, partial [Solirubrobacteraceae bacterium]|nr:P-loop NTPase fold protein [Solirubrobacteraceae bacterium]
DERLSAELTDLIRDDGWAVGTGGGDGQSWSYEISDLIRSVGKARDVDDLIALRFGLPLAEAEEPAAPEQQPEISFQAAAEVTTTPNADRPISHPEEDRLQRTALAGLLAKQAATSIPEGFVIGLSGPWGSGKTSLLNLITAEIEKHGSGHIFRFDPWMFSSSEELVLRFLRELAAEFQGTRRLRDLANSIALYAQQLAPLGSLQSDPRITLFVSAGQAIAGLFGARKKNRSALAQRREVEDDLAILEHRIIVLIDDLDRLTPGEIRDVMRLVKLVADFPNTTYILAYDKHRVAQALEQDGERDGQQFLEKIVQLTHEVPPIHPRRLRELLNTAIGAAVDDPTRYPFTESLYVNMFADLAGLFENLRDIARYANALPDTLELTSEEVELADVLALEAIRTRAPDSFARLLAFKDALVPLRPGLAGPADVEAVASRLESIIAAAGPHAQHVRGLLAQLFPAVQGQIEPGGLNYGWEWLPAWSRERRVAHPQVFDIYLAKALPPGTLPSSIVRSALESFGDPQALGTVVGGLDDEQLESLLERLGEHRDDLPLKGAEATIAVLFNQQQRLQRPRRDTSDPGAGHAVPVLVAALLGALGPAATQVAVYDALARIVTLSDQGELVRLACDSDDGAPALLEEPAATNLREQFLHDVLQAEPATLAGERDLLVLMCWAARASPERADVRLAQLTADQNFLLSLLASGLHEGIRQGVREAAVCRSQQLHWQALSSLIPEPTLIRVIEGLAGRLTDERLSPTSRLALRLALEHAASARPDGQNEKAQP